MCPCLKPECKRGRSNLDVVADEANPVKGFEEKNEAGAGAVPGRVAVVGRLSAGEPGKGYC